ncbi:MAG TPA: hypothetical protein IAA63_13995 [Candidatus Pullilachnospira stercoravium]|uniref:Gram-positive cocci surface proteins LPxTG domain-containing protein n=1 Tax=Candidatus Pullilachnospira stercoravium TaxID=2840913 RepID=A0A9D1T7G5_9FIRM|nr:hypothetical protein [Candidatus Pullilachnospira stercoravium]
MRNRKVKMTAILLAAALMTAQTAFAAQGQTVSGGGTASDAQIEEEMSGTAEVGNEAGKDSSAQKDTGESVTEEDGTAGENIGKSKVEGNKASGIEENKNEIPDDAAGQTDDEENDNSGTEPEDTQVSGVEPEDMQKSGVEPENMQGSGMEPEDTQESSTESGNTQESSAEPEDMQESSAEPEDMQESGMELADVQAEILENGRDAAADTLDVSGQEERGVFVGTTFAGYSQGESYYESDLIRMLEDASGDVTIRMMLYGFQNGQSTRLTIPQSVLEKVEQVQKRLIVEVFQPGYDMAMFNSRWVFDPSMPSYGVPGDMLMGIDLGLDSPYYSDFPGAWDNNPIAGLLPDPETAWIVFDFPQTVYPGGEGMPGFYVEVADRGVFEGINSMPLYRYDKEGNTLYRSGYGYRGNAGIVSGEGTGWETVRIYNPLAGQSYAVLDRELSEGDGQDTVYNYLPTELLRQQIADESVETIEIQLGACFRQDQYVVPAEILDSLKDSGKKLILKCLGVEAQPTYHWTFDGAAMDETMDVDLFVLFSYSVFDEIPEELALPQDSPSILLDFAHSGPLPEGTLISVVAPEEYNGQGYLYYYDETARTFTYTGRTSVSEWSNGFCFVTFSGIEHCSYYYMTMEELEGSQVILPTDPEEPTVTPIPPTDPEEPTVTPAPPADPEPSPVPVQPSEGTGTGTVTPSPTAPAPTQAAAPQPSGQTEQTASPAAQTVPDTGDNTQAGLWGILLAAGFGLAAAAAAEYRKSRVK